MDRMPNLRELAMDGRYVWAYAQHMAHTARSEPASHLFGFFAEEAKRRLEARQQQSNKAKGGTMKKAAGSRGRRVSFQITVEPGCDVFVAGSFNNWDPTQYRMRDNPGSGHCKTTIVLPPGRHEYKFVVNGEWRDDPSCAESVPNREGSLNSVISI